MTGQKRARWTKYDRQPAAEFRIRFCLTIREIVSAIVVDTCDAPETVRSITKRKDILQAVRHSLMCYGYTIQDRDAAAEESFDLNDDTMSYKDHCAIITSNVEKAFPELVRIEDAKAV